MKVLSEEASNITGIKTNSWQMGLDKTKELLQSKGYNYLSEGAAYITWKIPDHLYTWKRAII